MYTPPSAAASDDVGSIELGVISAATDGGACDYFVVHNKVNSQLSAVLRLEDALVLRREQFLPRRTRESRLSVENAVERAQGCKLAQEMADLDGALHGVVVRLERNIDAFLWTELVVQGGDVERERIETVCENGERRGT